MPAVLALLALPALAGVATAAAAASVVVSGTVHEALFSIALSDADGVAVGAGGALLESADSGRSWRSSGAAAQDPQALLGVGLARGRGIAVGQHGRVLVRDADGRWKDVSSGSTARLFAVGLNSSGRAVIGGAFGVVLKSDDGGASWTSIAPRWSQFTDGQEPTIYAAVVDDAGVITIAGEFGLILRSLDNGAQWRRMHKGEESLFGLDLRSDRQGYAVGQNGTVLQTRDGGASWKPLDPGSRANLLGVASSADGRVYVCGMHELLMSTDDGRSWRRMVQADSALPWYSGIALAPGARDAFTVGYSGQIVKVGD